MKRQREARYDNRSEHLYTFVFIVRMVGVSALHGGGHGFDSPTPNCPDFVVSTPLSPAAAQNGMTTNSNKPMCVTNAVLGMSSSAMGICQYPETRSKLMKNLELFTDANNSSIRGRGYLSCCVILLIAR